MNKVLLVLFTICFLSSCGPSTSDTPDTSNTPDSNTPGNPDPSTSGPPEDLTDADVQDLYIAQGSCWYKLSKNSNETPTRVAYEYAVGASAEEAIDNYKKTCNTQALYATFGAGIHNIYAYTTDITVKPCSDILEAVVKGMC